MLRIIVAPILLLSLSHFVLAIGKAKKRIVPCSSSKSQKGKYYLKSDGTRTQVYTQQGKLLWEKDFIGGAAQCLMCDDRNLYFTTQDTVLLCINPKGKEIWSDHINGSHTYWQLLPYGKHGFIVLVDESVYRGKLDDPKIENRIIYYRNRERIWIKNFPANAKVKVVGKQIYAVYSVKKRRIQRRMY